ncbi:MAG: magnesium transporter, partial [Gammaproteobacteria bacterium]|nr:magnesium transporter [Gammaproteobacteria bacterium]
MDIQEADSTQLNLLRLNEALRSGSYTQIRSALDILSPADSADLLETSPPTVRTILWNLLQEGRQAEILPL